MAARKRPQWLLEALGKEDTAPREQMTIISIGGQGGERRKPSRPMVPEEMFDTIGQMPPTYTGTGDNDTIEPDKPVDMVLTDEGPRMIHEGEIKMVGPGGRLIVVSAHELATIGGQEILKRLERSSSQMPTSDNTPKIPGYRGGTGGLMSPDSNKLSYYKDDSPVMSLESSDWRGTSEFRTPKPVMRNAKKVPGYQMGTEGPVAADDIEVPTNTDMPRDIMPGDETSAAEDDYPTEQELGECYTVDSVLGWINVPSIVNGELVSEEDALAAALETGFHSKPYDSIEEATAALEASTQEQPEVIEPVGETDELQETIAPPQDTVPGYKCGTKKVLGYKDGTKNVPGYAFGTFTFDADKIKSDMTAAASKLPAGAETQSQPVAMTAPTFNVADINNPKKSASPFSFDAAGFVDSTNAALGKAGVSSKEVAAPETVVARPTTAPTFYNPAEISKATPAPTFAEDQMAMRTISGPEVAPVRGLTGPSLPQDRAVDAPIVDTTPAMAAPTFEADQIAPAPEVETVAGPAPTGNVALQDEALGNIAAIMRGQSPVDQAIMNKYLSSMRASGAMDRKKLAQQMSVDPNLSDGARRALAGMQQAAQDSTEGDMMAQLSMDASKRAEAAAGDVFGKAQSAEVFQRQLADQDWARALNSYDPANPAELKALQDMYVSKFGGMPPSLAALSEQRNYIKAKQTQDITAGNLGIDASQWSLLQTKINDGADLGAVNEWLTSIGKPAITEAQLAGIRASSASGRADRSFDTDQSRYQDNENWKAYTAALQAEDFDGAAAAYQKATGSVIDMANMKQDRAMMVEGNQIKLDSMKTSLGDQNFASVRTRVDAGLPYGDGSQFDFNGDGKPDVTEAEFNSVRDASPLGERDFRRRGDAAGVLLANPTPANISRAAELLGENYPGVSFNFSQKINDANAESIATVQSEMLKQMAMSTSMTWDKIPEAVRNNWIATSGMNNDELKEWFGHLKTNEIDEMRGAVTGSDWYKGLEVKDQRMVDFAFNAGMTGAATLDAVEKFNVLDGGGNVISSHATKAEADAAAVEYAKYAPPGVKVEVDYDIMFKRPDGTAGSVDAGTAAIAGAGTKEGEYYVTKDGSVAVVEEGAQRVITPQEIRKMQAENPAHPELMAIAALGPGGEVVVKTPDGQTASLVAGTGGQYNIAPPAGLAGAAGKPPVLVRDEAALNKWVAVADERLAQNNPPISAEDKAYYTWVKGLAGTAFAKTPANPQYKAITSGIVAAVKSDPAKLMRPLSEGGIIGVEPNSQIYKDVFAAIPGEKKITSRSISPAGHESGDLLIPHSSFEAGKMVSIDGELFYVKGFKRQSVFLDQDASKWELVDVSTGTSTYYPTENWDPNKPGK